METATLARDLEDNGRRLARWIGLRGLITIALGVLFLARPGAGVAILLGVFAAYCFLDGILLLGAAISGGTSRGRGMLALDGLVSIAAGVLTFTLPGNAAVVLLFVIALRALFVGALEVIAAIRLGHTIPNPGLLALNGILAILFGVLLARNPQAGILSLAWLVGVYGVVVGVSQVVAAFGLRRVVKQAPPPVTVTPVRS
jgi:uncharacterized membrane protein HdeD (DUF308 family)